MRKGNGKGFIMGAVIGGVLGTVTALLFAPKSGKELRSDISEQVQSIGEKTKELAKSVGNHTSDWVGKAKEAGTSVVEEIRTWKFPRSDEEAAQETAIASISCCDEEEFLQQGENI